MSKKHKGLEGRTEGAVAEVEPVVPPDWAQAALESGWTPPEKEGGTANVGSEAANVLYRLILDELLDENPPPPPARIERFWNRHVEKEASLKNEQSTTSGKSLKTTNYRKIRQHFWAVNAGRLNPIAVIIRPEGSLQLKAPVTVLTTTNVERPVSDPPVKKVPVKKVPVKAPPSEDLEKLSATERAILLSFGSSPIENVSLDDATDEEALLRLADEANAAENLRKEFVAWASSRAEAEIKALPTKVGEALWTNAVTVEQYGEHANMRVIFVRSSTAPMFGTHGPTVKHDFRANRKPVNINHEGMFRQLDNHRLIRSKVVTDRAHEYYVKALRYQEGMYFKGYFVVGGKERTDLARYYVCRDGKVVTIDEAEYERLENQAARRPR